MCHHQLPLWLLTEEERTSSGCDESCIWLSGQDKTSGPMDNNRKDWTLTERIGFVNRKDWTPEKFDGICAMHFESQYIKVGSKLSKVTKDNSVKPTICTEELQKLYDAKPSLCPTSMTTRKKPTDRNPPLLDEMKAFVERDRISDFTGLTECTAPVGFSYEKFDDYVLYYKIVFGSKDEAPYSDSI